MLDGAMVRGSIIVGHSGGLENILSKETPFLEFHSKQGQRKFLAKHQIAYIEPVEPLRKPMLIPKNDPRYVDAFSMLGVPRNCTLDQAIAAFREKAKLYHPDTVAALALPQEVERYMTETFKQINTAYTEVRAELQEAA